MYRPPCVSIPLVELEASSSYSSSDSSDEGIEGLSPRHLSLKALSIEAIEGLSPRQNDKAKLGLNLGLTK